VIRHALALGFSALVAVATVDCHRAPETSPAVIAQDSLRGIVSITGSSFAQAVMLRTGNSTVGLALNASDSAALSRMGGIDVALFGTREPNRFRVRSFRAMAVSGAPVVDGVLREADGKLWIYTSEGAIALGNPPAQLRNLIGARVWIGGPLATGPNQFGVISPATR
jgi:hypothetical protein